MGERRRFRFGRVLIALLAIALAVPGGMHLSARSDPVLRRASVALPDWPAGARPVRVLLWSDLHLGNRATGRGRLSRLVTLANAARPDLIVLAGDYVAGHRREDAAAAVAMVPKLGRLRAPLGVVAVMGNHEYWTDAPAIRAALERAGVTVLANGAVRRGPLAIGGVDDMVNRRADVAATAAALSATGGAAVWVSHSPDLAPRLPADARLLLAGHSHCGQVLLPLWGPISEVTQPRYRCGLVREGRRLTVVGAGTGTSVLPLRLGAPPDWWLLTLGPARPRR
jgi:uncharacterized protein